MNKECSNAIFVRTFACRIDFDTTHKCRNLVAFDKPRAQGIISCTEQIGTSNAHQYSAEHR